MPTSDIYGQAGKNTVFIGVLAKDEIGHTCSIKTTYLGE